MSHTEPGPLASYNSLQDPHLGGYFANTRMKNHLQKSGLVTKSGKVVSEKTYRLKMAKKEHQDQVRDLLATAIVHKALDMERSRQHQLRRRLDEMYKVELVKRVKAEREQKGDETVMSLLTAREKVKRSRKRRPRTAPSEVLTPTELGYDEDTGRLFYNIVPSASSNGDEINSLISGNGYNPYYKPYPPATYPMPAPPPSRTPRAGSKSRASTAGQKRNKSKLHRYTYLAHSEPAVAHKVQLQSMAEVTMKFLGPKLQLKNDMFPEERLGEVMVLQQHCGGSTLCVFRELLPPNTIFTFVSRRHRGTPFGLTFYIDGMQDIRLSSCCEYKHKPGHILGGKNGHFQFVNVEGAAPCYRCQIAFSMKDKSRSKRKSCENEPNSDAAQLKADEHDLVESTVIERNAEHNEVGVNGDVTERFEVTITKVSPESDNEDSAVMVDTTTQTPRDVSEQERSESKSSVFRVEDEREAAKDDEEKEDDKDKENVGAKNTGDSGIQDLEENYADDDFEEDDDVEPDNDKGEASETEDMKLDQTEEKNDYDDSENERPSKVHKLDQKENGLVEEIKDEDETTGKGDEVEEDDEVKEDLNERGKNEDAEDVHVKDDVVENDLDKKEAVRDDIDKSSSEDEGEETGKGESKPSSSSSSSESDDTGDEMKDSEKDSEKESEKDSKKIQDGESGDKLENESMNKVDKEPEKDFNDGSGEMDLSRDSKNDSGRESKNELEQQIAGSEKNSKNDLESESERSRNALEIDTARALSQKSEKKPTVEDSLNSGGEVKDSRTDSDKKSAKDSDLKSDLSSKVDLETNSTKTSDKESDAEDSDKHPQEPAMSAAETESDKESEKDVDKNSEKESVVESVSDSDEDSKKDTDTDSEKDSEEENDSDKDSDSDSSKDSDKDSSSTSDLESDNDTEKEVKSESDADLEKASEKTSETSLKEDFYPIGSGENRPDSRSGILHGSSKNFDISEDEERVKKTVSFNEEVRVYVGVEDNGAIRETENAEAQEKSEDPLENAKALSVDVTEEGGRGNTEESQGDKGGGNRNIGDKVDESGGEKSIETKDGDSNNTKDVVEQEKQIKHEQEPKDDRNSSGNEDGAARDMERKKNEEEPKVTENSGDNPVKLEGDKNKGGEQELKEGEGSKENKDGANGVTMDKKNEEVPEDAWDSGDNHVKLEGDKNEDGELELKKDEGSSENKDGANGVTMDEKNEGEPKNAEDSGDNPVKLEGDKNEDGELVLKEDEGSSENKDGADGVTMDKKDEGEPKAVENNEDKREKQEGDVGKDDGPGENKETGKEENKTEEPRKQETGEDEAGRADGNVESEHGEDVAVNENKENVEGNEEKVGETVNNEKDVEKSQSERETTKEAPDDGKSVEEQTSHPEEASSNDVKDTKETGQGGGKLMNNKKDSSGEHTEEVSSPVPSDSDTGSKQTNNQSEKEPKDTDTDIDLDPGNDPDAVAGEVIPERALKAVGTKPGAKHEGSVKPLVEGQKDLEIASVALNSSQVEEVASMVENNPEVGSLSLRNVSLGDKGIKHLSSVLKNSANVKMLNLNVNNIGPDGARHVADTIRSNTAIKMLLLHGNPLGDEGVVFIIDAILENEETAVSTLDIGDCGLGDNAATQVSRLLESNNTITDLNLSANQITHKGWREISEALKKNKKLRTLSLDYNKITDEDVAVIADGLRQSTTLRSVDLEANRIRDEGGRILLDVVKENEKLIDVTLMPMNQIDQSILTQIKDILDNRIRSRPSSANSETPTT